MAKLKIPDIRIFLTSTGLFLLGLGFEISPLSSWLLAILFWFLAIGLLVASVITSWPRQTSPPALHALASLGEDILLLEPLDGAVVSQRTRVRGYARTFEANVLIQERHEDDWRTIGQTTAKGMAEDATAFQTEILLSPGTHILRIGDVGPQGEPEDWVGVEVTITVQ